MEVFDIRYPRTKTEKIISKLYLTLIEETQECLREHLEVINDKALTVMSAVSINYLHNMIANCISNIPHKEMRRLFYQETKSLLCKHLEAIEKCLDDIDQIKDYNGVLDDKNK